MRRVAGYQHAIDIEVMRSKTMPYLKWLGHPDENDVPVTEFIALADGIPVKLGVSANQVNRRTFIERYPELFDTFPFPMVDLPLRLKRKLCIEWNHIYRDWLLETGYEYDFERREFFSMGTYTDAQAAIMHDNASIMNMLMNMLMNAFGGG